MPEPAPLANAGLCTQCGYCLPVCPTYRVENNELHAPRGRVSILLAVQAGELSIEEAAAVLDHCLVCRACHAACPAGVRPAKLAMVVRAMATPRSPPLFTRLLHRITNSHPLTARLAALLAFYQRSGLQEKVRRMGLLRLLPALARLESLIPRHRPALRIPPFPPTGTPDKPRIGLLGGCMARLFFPEVTPSAAQLLGQWGEGVVPLEGFGCCGAPFREAGDRPAFLRQARRTLDAFHAAGDLLAVVCDSSICAVTAHSYGRALANDPTYATLAKNFSAKVQTLSQFLANRLEQWPPTPCDPGSGAITFLDHCQTRYGLGIIKEPRRLLSTLPILYRELTEIESTLFNGCCGAGGDYQLRHPTRSQLIREQKLLAIRLSGADTVVGENPGCLLHIASGLEQTGSPVQVRHLADLLWTAQWLQQPTQKVP
ncbi:MAG: (Fe-S)-binding protein [Magnetococcus sp. XQGC-1]